MTKIPRYATFQYITECTIAVGSCPMGSLEIDGWMDGLRDQMFTG